MFIFRGTHVEQQLLLWRFFRHLPVRTKLSRITSSQPCKHAASITESPSQDKLLLIRQFFARLTGPLPSKCTLTVAYSFAELLRKYPHPQTPAISRGRIRGNANTRGLVVWLSQSLALAASARMCFKTMVFGCGEASPSEAWLLPRKGKVNVRYHSPAGPPDGRRW